MITPQIIFLDQNKWIELLRAEKSPDACPREYAILQGLIAKLQTGKIVLPLSGTNIYETYKIADPQRRQGLAELQSGLSGGLVFRGRHSRIESELSVFLSNAYKLPLLPQVPWWFLSDIFFEAFSDADDDRTSLNLSDKLLQFIRQNSAFALRDYLTSAPDGERVVAVKKWSEGSNSLRSRIESRRKRHQN